MTYKMCGAAIAILSAVMLTLLSDPTFARSGAAVRGGSISTHSISHRPVAHLFRHFKGNSVGAVWPAIGDYGSSDFYGPLDGEATAGLTPPTVGDIYGVPWDWAHRYPPHVVPSERPYVASCPSETVTVPGRGGQDQTVNIIRCY